MRLGRQHFRNGVATIKTEKSGFAIDVTLPILPVLEATLDAGPCGDLTFVAGAIFAPSPRKVSATSSAPLAKNQASSVTHGVRNIDRDTRGNNGATEMELVDLRLDRPQDGRPLHAKRKQTAACDQSNGQVGERRRNIYSRTFAPGAGRRTQSKMKSMPNFEMWAWEGSNLQPDGYEPPALTN